MSDFLFFNTDLMFYVTIWNVNFAIFPRFS